MTNPLTICFAGTFEWEANLRRDVHRLFEGLAARGHRLVYVEPATPFGRPAPALVRPVPSSPSITLVTPRTIRGQRITPIGTANAALERRALRKAWDLLGLPEPDVVMVHSARRAFYWYVFRSSLRVWRNYDFVGDPEEAARMAERADVVLTTSPRYARLRAFGDAKTRYLPNTCDELSATASGRGEEHPGPPLVGTMGTFGATMDLDLLGRLTRACRTVGFLFQGIMGDASVTRSEVLERLSGPHVELIERRDSDLGAVEGFLRRIRVGLCPYGRTEWNLFAAPSKLLAFLRAGLPVITTDFSPDSLEAFRALPGVFVVNDQEEACRAIPVALEAGRDPEVVGRLTEAAQPYLASNVAIEFERLVADALLTGSA